MDGDRNDRTAGFCCNFERSFMKREHLQLIRTGVSGTLRENHDGYAVTDQVDAGKDRLESLPYVAPIEKLTVQQFHPVREGRDFQHFLFGNIAGQPAAACICQDDIEVTSMIADIKNRNILWNTVFADDGNFCAGQKGNNFESSLYNPQGS